MHDGVVILWDDLLLACKVCDWQGGEMNFASGFCSCSHMLSLLASALALLPCRHVLYHFGHHALDMVQLCNVVQRLGGVVLGCTGCLKAVLRNELFQSAIQNEGIVEIIGAE